MEQIKGKVKKTFFAGLVMVIPILITAFTLFWLFRLLDGFLSPILLRVLGIQIPGLGILIEILLIFAVGVVATNVFGSRLLKWIQALLMRTPVVKNIYPTIKQLVEAFQPSTGSAFKKVVLVEYPRSRTFALGFLTSEVSLKGPAENIRLYSVYLPTNNLYLGHVALFRVEDVFITHFTVEEGLKIILSGGTAFPPMIQKQDPASMP